MHPVHVDAAADVLVNFSQRFEAAAETALLQVRARYEEAMHPHGEQLYPTELSTKPGNHSNGSGNFDTQWKFQTIIPPDEDLD